jgi:hypothetical protein
MDQRQEKLINQADFLQDELRDNKYEKAWVKDLQNKRIKIAEAVGASWYYSGDEVMVLSFGKPHHLLGPDRFEVADDIHLAGNVPDYFNNRDAITKAVIALLDTYEKQIEYCKRLTAMQHADEPPFFVTLEFATVNATAEQRAEAFGQTLNLW